MNLTEKILALHAQKERVFPNDIIEAEVDYILGNELSTIVAINEFNKTGIEKVCNPEKLIIVLDHFTPSKDIKTAQLCIKIREFASKFGINNIFDVGRGGIEHVILPEKGFVKPGSLIIGGDSHTCTYGAFGSFATGVGSTDMAAGYITGKAWFKVPYTIRVEYTGELQGWTSAKDVILHTVNKLGVAGARYKALYFCGKGLSKIDMAGRMTISNMAIEMGAKIGIMDVDKITEDYLSKIGVTNYKPTTNDNNAEFESSIQVDINKIKPLVSLPHLPSNTMPADELHHIKVNQVVLGSCTNGRIEDLRIAANILKGKKIHRDIRMIILPGSQEIVLQAIKEGIYEIFISAGAAVSTPTCGPCVGGHMGILGEGERCLSTTNRNFKGRMGHSTSEIYLGSPAVAAATALKGYICTPE